MADDAPKERPTVDIEKPPAWAISFIEEQKRQGNALRSIANDVTDLHEGVRSTKADMADFRADVCGHLHDLDKWRKGTSDRVRSESDVNLKQSADIAAVLTRVDNLGKAVDDATKAQTAAIIGAIQDAAKSPLGKIIMAAVVAAVSGWLAGKGIQFK